MLALLHRLTPVAAAAAAVTTALLLSACGGGSAEAPPGSVAPTPAPAPAPTPAPQASTGLAVDGYLIGASVLCDSNGNGLADSGEVSVSTDSAGRFTFATACTTGLVLTGGTNADTRLPFKGRLQAPAGAALVTPLTTLLVAGLTQAQINTAMGLPAGTDVLTTDPALKTGGVLVNADLLKKTVAMQQLMLKVSEVFAGLGSTTTDAALQPIYAEVNTAFAILLKGGGQLNTGSTIDQTVLAKLVQAAAARVGQSTAVSPAVKAAVAAVNAESLGMVTAGALKVQAEALLKASDADFTAVTTLRQSETTIAAFVVAKAAELTGAPTAATQALATTLATTVAAGPTPTPTPTPAPSSGTTLVNFEESTAPTLTGFGGAENASISADPSGGTNKVGKVVKAAGSEVWAGTTVSTGANQSIATIPFTASATTLTLRVWSPDAGIRVRLKLESASDNTKTVEVDALTTVAGAWQTLSFNFASPAAGTAAFNLATVYNKASVFFNFGTAGTGKTYYFDDLNFPVASATPSPAPTPTPTPAPAPAPAPADYLAVVADSISLVNGAISSSYSMSQFQSDAGIAVAWPLPATMTLRVALAEVGTYAIATDLKLTAAVSITETTATGKGEVQAYLDNVSIKKTANGLEVSVPSLSKAMVYGVSSDGKKKAVIDFSSSVAGVTNTLRTAAGSSNSILLGNVVNYAINKVSNDFTGIYSLRGKYKVSLVLTGLPLRRADGSELPAVTIVVPTALDSSGAVAASKSVTGLGLSGTITLVD